MNAMRGVDGLKEVAERAAECLRGDAVDVAMWCTYIASMGDGFALFFDDVSEVCDELKQLRQQNAMRN